MFWWIVSGTGAIVLTAAGSVLIIHIASTYSSMGRVIMATSAMSPIRIIPKEEEERLTPSQLSVVLLNETRQARKAKIPVNQQYRMKHYHESVRLRHSDAMALAASLEEVDQTIHE